ncbi:anti-sigma factor family protein [Labilibaculum antarcticum]|uniref:Putative zinc-finger domain-containing protein n=1 Tax=Labilibaculum antarcticum TaxID=1717717 RepID=A0A1Y1CMR4_9BACT|nr:zf-HC2 domain-containing protein [Labilibaculum antarcticum]BAX81645.1 hypothetical protein ALGA_3347 [Labilibaculum antarcticum]
MNCINDEFIQRYIDGELDVAENLILQDHIESCVACEAKLIRQVKIVAGIKEAIGNFVDENIEIPEFKFTPKRGYKKSIVRKMFYDLSAASAILIFVGIQMFQEKDVQTELMIRYQFESEYDANLPITEQEMSFDFFDENGKIIE